MGKHLGRKIVLGVVIAAVLAVAVGAGVYFYSNRTTNVDERELAEADILKGKAKSEASLHDPMVIVGEDGTYYMYGSHMTEASATELSDWSMIADGVRKSNPMFDNLFDESMDAFAFVGRNSERSYSVWAPSVIYNEKMGKYVMYFCTTSSYIKSNLCMATSDTPEGPYTYQDTILYSGFVRGNIKKTDFEEVMGTDYKMTTYVKNGGFLNSDWPNCIDPAAFYDADGRMWMVYGSWSGGIFLLEIDEETGDVIHPEADPENGVDAYYGKRLVGGGHHAVEGPYIQYCAENGYYYLFLSYGNLTSNGGYQIREFRSENVDGPYVDAQGNTLGYDENFEDFGVKMIGNYTLPSLDVTYMAPGGQSSFVDKDGKMYMVYHQRFDEGQEYHQPRIHQLFVTEDNWLAMAPFETSGETLSAEGYTTKDICGNFYMINNGLDVSSSKRKVKKATFATDGSFQGEFTGTFAVKEGTNDISFVMDGIIYNGKLIAMKDEAGNDTLCFTAVGENNKTLWGVHYIQKEEE